MKISQILHSSYGQRQQQLEQLEQLEQFLMLRISLPCQVHVKCMPSSPSHIHFRNLGIGNCKVKYRTFMSLVLTIYMKSSKKKINIVIIVFSVIQDSISLSYS